MVTACVDDTTPPIIWNVAFDCPAFTLINLGTFTSGLLADKAAVNVPSLGALSVIVQLPVPPDGSTVGEHATADMVTCLPVDPAVRLMDTPLELPLRDAEIVPELDVMIFPVDAVTTVLDWPAAIVAELGSFISGLSDESATVTAAGLVDVKLTMQLAALLLETLKGEHTIEEI
jgi:hypothetical protein